MTFKELSGYFQKLESTAGRNQMVVILAQLFKEASTSEIDKIAYLLQGRVAPLYEPIEFGMADKMVIKAMARAYGESDEEITKLFKKTGDLGAVAESLGKKSREELTVVQVFEKLSQITQTGGAGSVEKKVELLANLLRDSDSLSAKYIARTPVDKLRLGFSDMTMLEGLSWYISGTKKHKEKIEAAYNIRPDLGYISGQVKKSGLGGLSHVKPKVGTPILVMKAERLTSAAEILDKTGGKCAVEPKIDGFRLQLHYSRSLAGPAGLHPAPTSSSAKGETTGARAGAPRPSPAGGYHVRLFSRGLENVTGIYPDIVAAAEKEISAREVILDGEAIGFSPKTGKYLPFQETVQRKRKYDIETFAKNVPLKLIVFDCLYLDGESLIEKPYRQRREVVENVLHSPKTIIPAQMQVVSQPEELEKIFNGELAKGLEGIMAKKLDGVYQAGARGWNWIKLKGSYVSQRGKSKLADTIDAVVMGIDYGQGKRSKFGVGSFLVGVYDQKTDTFKTISKIGTGLTDEEWRELKVKSQKLKVQTKPKNYDVNKVMACDEWLRPQVVGEFLADEITKSPMHTAGYALRFPRLVGWREKKPEDTTSLKEILEIVKLQKK